MSEREVQPERAADLAPEVAKLHKDLDEAAYALIKWQTSSGSDSVRMQQDRKYDYTQVCNVLELMPSRAEAQGFQLQLAIGEKPIRTLSPKGGV